MKEPAADSEPGSELSPLLNQNEIDLQIATAHKYPRSISNFRKEVYQLVTLSEAIADECFYALPRDGKMIEGPSARFAEIIASCWGNARAGSRVVSEGDDFIVAQGVFHDLERNWAVTREVPRRITDKKGKRYGADMVGVTGNAAASIALRNAVLAGIPKALWADLYEAARLTAAGDVKTLPTRRAAVMDALAKLGVPAAAVFAKLQVAGLDDVGLDEIVTLKGLLTAIKEGDSSVEQIFAADGLPAGFNVGRKSAAPPPPPPTPDLAGSSQQAADLAARRPDLAPSDLPAEPVDPFVEEMERAEVAQPKPEKLIGAGEVAYLKAKAKANGVDLQVILEQMGGLLLEKLTKGDFERVKARVMGEESEQ